MLKVWQTTKGKRDLLIVAKPFKTTKEARQWWKSPEIKQRYPEAEGYWVEVNGLPGIA